ncbi:MAG: RNA methyltransferase [Proteobacteria bacterium]|nr:RNA methyltransferase [Pseudomonadota bacterium]
MGRLQAIRVVLVCPTHPGNIGAAARAMKTMGVTDLALVQPKHFPSDEADARASGASDVLEQARVFDSLDQAIADCSLVVGSSARSRHIGWPTWLPDECATELLAATAKGPVALVFGRERTGLTNEELDRCHAMVSIPANPGFSSLNLGSAVQLLCYEMRRAAGATLPVRESAEEKTATREQMELFYEHLQSTLVETEFLDPAQPKLLMRRLQRLFNRAQPDERELNILRGILTSVERRCHQKTK